MRTDHLIGTVASARAMALVMLTACSGVGCVVGPEYRSPDPTLAPLHNVREVQAREAPLPPPPLDRWWAGFHDPVLTRVVQRALDQNLDVAAACARVRQARAVAREAGAQLLPSGDLNAQAAPFHQSLESPIGKIAQHLPGYQRDQTLYDFGAAASWEIDLFGGLRRGSEAASALAQVAEAEQLGTRVSIAAEAADAFLQIRGDQQRLRVAQTQVATDQHLLELVRLRFAAGAAPDREVAQAEGLLAQARSTIPPLQVALEAQMNRLDVLMGEQPGTDAAGLSVPEEIPEVPSIAAMDASQDLLRRRPDIIAAERRLAASNARIGVAISGYYPKISLAALVGFESLSSDQLFSAESFQPAAAAGIRWRLFDFGRVDAEVTQARAADTEALSRYRESVLKAAEDVENASMALVQFERQSAELKREVDALARARDESQEDYEAGAIALTDVLDSDRELLVAQDNLAQSRADTGRAGVALFRALGGGW
jgi:NodT family efflux transporter outer membrane factor (OMF) lipoprotein